MKISKYFCKIFVPTWLEEAFVIKKKLKSLYRELILLMVLMMKKLLEIFMKKNCKKQIKKNLE